jgi:hypothetical protein
MTEKICHVSMVLWTLVMAFVIVPDVRRGNIPGNYPSEIAYYLTLWVTPLLQLWLIAVLASWRDRALRRPKRKARRKAASVNPAVKIPR